MSRKNKSNIYNNDKYIFASWISIDDKKVIPTIKLLEKKHYRICHSNVEHGITRKSFNNVDNAYVIIFFVSNASMEKEHYVQFIENSIQKKETSKVIMIMLERDVKLKSYIDFLTTAYQRMNCCDMSADIVVKKLEKNDCIIECRSKSFDDYSNVADDNKAKLKTIIIASVVGFIVLVVGLNIVKSVISNNTPTESMSIDKSVNLDSLNEKCDGLEQKQMLNNNSVLWFLLGKNKTDKQSDISVSIPFASTNADEEFVELKNYIMTDPVICDMIIRVVSNISLGDSDYKYYDAESWIREYLEKTGSFDNGLVSFVQNVDGQYILTDEYLVYAQNVCNLLEKFERRNDIFNGREGALNSEMNFYIQQSDVVEKEALVFSRSGFEGNKDFFGIALENKQIIVP